MLLHLVVSVVSAVRLLVSPCEVRIVPFLVVSPGVCGGGIGGYVDVGGDGEYRWECGNIGGNVGI